MARSKRIELKKPKRLNNRKSRKQRGGSPAYRLFGEQGLLSQSSLNHSPVPLTTHENGHSDHIVHTSGGGGCGSMKKSRRKGKGRSRRGKGISAMVAVMRSRRRAETARRTTSKPVRRSTGSKPRRRRSYVSRVKKNPKRQASYLGSIIGF
jgi:hypothetical protein